MASARQPEERRALLGVCLATSLLPLELTAVAAALPGVQRSLHAGYGSLQWVEDAYTLVLAALLVVAGSLGGRFGHRRVFVAGTALFSLASLLAAAAPDVRVLIAARALQGLGGAGLAAGSLPVLSAAFSDPRRRTGAFGALASAIGVGAGLGPLIGGVAVGQLGWRAAFALLVLPGAAVCRLVLRLPDTQVRTDERTDWLGALLCAAASLALVGALVEAPVRGWSSLIVVALLLGTAGLVTALVRHVRGCPNPLVDLGIARRPGFLIACLAPLIGSIAYWAPSMFLPVYLQTVCGQTPTQAGLAMLPLAGPLVVVPLVTGQLSEQLGTTRVLVLGQLLIAGGVLAMAVGVAAGSGWVFLVPGGVLAGCGAGLTGGRCSEAALAAVPPAYVGMASGISATMRQLGVAVGFAGLGALLAAGVSPGVDAWARATASTADPAAASGSAQLGESVATGGLVDAAATLPAGLRAGFWQAARAAYSTGLMLVLVVGCLLALSGALVTWRLSGGRRESTHSSVALPGRHRPGPLGDRGEPVVGLRVPPGAHLAEQAACVGPRCRNRIAPEALTGASNFRTAAGRSQRTAGAKSADERDGRAPAGEAPAQVRTRAVARAGQRK